MLLTNVNFSIIIQNWVKITADFIRFSLILKQNISVFYHVAYLSTIYSLLGTC